jgi:F-type H+-transporting ATPase subunit b
MMKPVITSTLLTLSAPLAFAAEAADAGHGESSASFLHLIEPFTDPVTHVAFAAFALFLIIAASMGAFKAVAKALDSRAEDIQKQLDESRTLREEAAAMLADAEKKRAEADATADAMIKQAKADAKLMVEQARKDLADKVARREAQAEARIARAESEAAEDVRRVAANAATQAARDILAGSPKRGDLFEEALGEIDKALN